VRATKDGWPLIRPQPAQYVFSLVSMLIVLGILAVLNFGTPGLIAGACVGGVFLLLQVLRGGVELRPDTVVDRLPLGTRTTPWSNVTDVSTVSTGGAQLVQLTLVDGRRLKLYQPRSGGVFGRDPGFADKAALVRRSWLSGRG
jgi:hypothetical protein